MTTTLDEIKKDKDIVLEKLTEAEGKLEKWEEGEDDGQWLKKLKKKLRMLNSEIRREKDEEKKKILEGDSKDLEEEIGELEKEKERLTKKVDDWEKQVVKLQDALVAFGG